jgi:hypothetical protein
MASNRSAIKKLALSGKASFIYPPSIYPCVVNGRRNFEVAMMSAFAEEAAEKRTAIDESLAVPPAFTPSMIPDARALVVGYTTPRIKTNIMSLSRLEFPAPTSETIYDSKDREERIFEIPGLLAEHSTKALGDYGATNNFIKEDYATRLGLSIDRAIASKNVTVGGGQQVATTGLVTAPFRFEGESDVYNLKFHLLPNCFHDIILGKTFLRLTKTFSKASNFYRRVKERVVKGVSRFHLFYLGASSPMFEGSINGQPQTALADSGSKVLVMDEEYARSNGLPIQTGHEHQITLTFADNSTADTSGMAYDVEWRFGREGEFTSPYRLNFHILKNAPADVILCDTFLFDNEAFSRYEQYLVDNDDDYENEDDNSRCFAIDHTNQSKKFTKPQILHSLTFLSQGPQELPHLPIWSTGSLTTAAKNKIASPPFRRTSRRPHKTSRRSYVTNGTESSQSCRQIVKRRICNRFLRLQICNCNRLSLLNRALPVPRALD